jgi:hypothetical protein
VTTSAQDEAGQETIRETYEEFELGDTTVAMISDPRVDDAWIQSNVVQQIVP